MAKDLLLEIGTEELPPTCIPFALNQLKNFSIRILREQRIKFSQIKVYGTSRRLTLYISKVANKQEDAWQEIIGPPQRVGFDDQGNPTPAARGFAKSQKVDLKTLKIKKVKGKEYIYIRKKEKGKLSKEILKRILPQIITSLNFSRSMRWGKGNLSFARPIRWLLSLWGEEVIEFSLGDLKSGNLTYGHRFLSEKSQEVKKAGDYWSLLRKSFVIVDPDERRKIIQEQIGRIIPAQSELIQDEELLDIVVYMAEYPFAFRGSFPKRYLHLPYNVLISVMREHKRCFSLIDKKSNILPFFIALRDGNNQHMEIVKEGYERVLNARLADAEFFFEKDKKVSLEERVANLKGIVFQEKLGTLYEKTLRLVNLADYIASNLKLKAEEKENVLRASYLCKADLLTEMVGEFPRLEGIMGGEYARISGEKKEVASGIFEHYLPRNVLDMLPSTVSGSIISIVDKMDNVVSSFCLGLIPSGSEDPYGLRRQASGIIRIMENKKFTISLSALIKKSVQELKGKIDKNEKEMIDILLIFFQERIKSFLREKNISADLVEAVVSTGFDDIGDVSKRGEALQKLRHKSDFAEIAVAFKRVINILGQAKERFGYDFQSESVKLKFSEKQEKMLYETYLKIEKKLNKFIKEKDYESAFREVAKLRQPVDLFFDKVLVMVEDESLRKNRLAILGELGKMFLCLADFSKIIIRERSAE